MKNYRRFWAWKWLCE